MNTADAQPTTTTLRRVQPAWQRGVAVGAPMGMVLLFFIPALNRIVDAPLAIALIVTAAALGIGALLSVVMTKVIARHDRKTAARAEQRTAELASS